jgi:capsular exopolysaccharide synthesis family protein
MAPEMTLAKRPNYPAATEKSAPNVLSVGFVWNTFKHWWRIIIPTALVLTVAANAIVFAMHVPQYKAFTRLRIREAPDGILTNKGSRMGHFVANQLTILRSDMVLEPVLALEEISRIPELAQSRDQVATLADKLKVSMVGKSEFYEISYTSPVPKDAQAIVTAVTKSYLGLFSDVEDRRRSDLLKLLQDEKTKREGQVEQLESRLRQLARTAGGQLGTPLPPSINVQPGTVMSNLSPTGNGQLSPQFNSIQAQRAAADVDLLIVRNQIKQFEQSQEAAGAIEVPPAVIEQQLQAHPYVLQLVANVTAARTKLLDAQGSAREKDPAKNDFLKSYARELERAEKLLADSQQSLRPEIESQLRTAEEQRRAQTIEQLKVEEKNLQLVLSSLDERYQKELNDVKELAGDTLLDIEFTRMEMAYAQQILGTINSRMISIDVESRAPPPVEPIIDEARLPTKPDAIIPTKKMGLTSAATMLFPFLLALLWEYRVRRVSSARELEDPAIYLPVVAEVTRLPVQTVGKSTSLRLQQDLWLFEESVETLRTCLFLSEPGRQLQVIAVTSATSREGKTSVASQLAVSLARATDQPTLLIDGDMRSPDIHGIFDVEGEVGLTNALSQEVSMDEAVCSTWQNHLDVLPAGQLACSPHKLVGKGAFKSVLDAARRKYRFIVIDTPPILAASEALIMAKEADASLLCTMRSVSRMSQVRAAHDRLQQSGANPVGIVLNGVPTTSYYYKYGKYSYNRD